MFEVYKSNFDVIYLLKFDWFICLCSVLMWIERFGAQNKMKTEEDSFEEVKRNLEESLGISAVVAPPKPMNPYMRFFLERSSEERSKGRRDWSVITKELTVEWNELSASKREYYQKIYEVRLRERNALLDDYEILANKRKPLPPYARYVKRRYAQYAKELKNATPAEINKLISEDWAKISPKEKKKLEDEYNREKNDAELKIDNSDKIEEYSERLKRYQDQLTEDKEKILKKYGLTKENRARLKRQDKEQQRRQKRAQRRLELEQRRREAQEIKQREKEAKRKQKQEEREALKIQRQEERHREKERARLQREQNKAQAAQQKRKRKEEEKTKKSKKPAVKQQAKETKKPAAKSKGKAKVEAKKPQKSKKIKKIVAKKAKAVKEEESPKKPAPKPKAKAKPKAKPAKKATKATKITKGKRAKK